MQEKDAIKFRASYVIYKKEASAFKIIAGSAYNPDNRRWICDCSIKGNLLDVGEDDEIFAVGRWENHPLYGKDFRVDSYCKVLPNDPESILKYLMQGNIKEVTKKRAKLLIEKFGDQTLNVMLNYPGRLVEVKGIGRITADKIHCSAVKNLAEQEMLSTIMSYIQGFGISPAYARRIYNAFGLKSIQIIKENPYILAEKIRGIGFKMADAIALKNNVPPDSPKRLESAVQYVLQKANENGDVFSYVNDVKKDCQSLLGINIKHIEQTLQNLEERDRIVREGEALYLSSLFQAEKEAAMKLANLLQFGTQKNIPISEQEVFEAGIWNGVQLAEEQVQAVVTACTSGVMIITGGPGTGKTTIVRLIIEICKQHHLGVLCAAPTGKATKRMREATGNRSAQTLHKLLGAKGDPELGFRFEVDEENPLDGDVLIIDECSMIDISLLNSLLKGVPFSMKVIFVGDVDQLPSVGCGNIFGDMIGSGVIPTVRLQHIFRQEKESLIVKNAHLINHGVLPDFNNVPDTDWHFRDVSGMEKEKIRDLVVAYVAKYIPKKFGVDPMDVQVLTPVKKGETGVYQLNSYIQDKINPPDPDKPEMVDGERLFRLGDKIMCIKNDYDRFVFNGDVGKIVDIRLNDEGEDNIDENEDVELINNCFTVDFGDHSVTFKKDELEKFTLAYAMTVHKSQGSEYDYVVLVMANVNFLMLKRNLLYTGVTRAKKLLCMVGQKRSVACAVRSVSVNTRKTRFKERIQKYCRVEEKQTA